MVLYLTFYTYFFYFQYGSHIELEQNNNISGENIEQYSSEDITALKDLDEKLYLKRYFFEHHNK